ncbi:neutral zinc metallopeptidase [Thalassotalea ponticola]|uniref:KPN_02809 family neutral zinc metallopeptidase n=1 Tax=Thalassotalea ponticola TaxID=1523392 RepID=UPI0025B4EDCE|nr:neutral zinc metallopeptidase [Thalassotalea ponticola]MDN3652805.1 neutral zinc metallopeptidase [Thalassotalea ponticola]
MRWQGKRKSTNVEDRRGQRVVAGAGLLAGVVRFIPYLLKSKLGRMVLIVGVVGYFGAQMLGFNLAPNLSSGTTQGSVELTPQQQQLGEFVSVVLADTEDTWTQLLQQHQVRYREPVLVLFTQAVQSACGTASSAVGPFYCPADEKLYIDLSFYQDLKNRHGAPGDFAQAYVIAHEVGHHLQKIFGTTDKVHRAQQSLGKSEANQLSVRLELQADCFAGVWGYHAHTKRNMLEAGDLEEALTAAAAIGDDRLQKQAQGRVTPDSFTHGSSEQRVRWFKRGFDNGDFTMCNTFDSNAL